MIDTIAYVQDETVTALHIYPTGYLLTENELGEEVIPRGFVYSADLAAQRFFELTGIELEVEELVA
jgi:hypothetical protein